MRVIDLLNKIANGEEVPKRIEYGKGQFHWNEKIRNYEDDNLKYAYINWDIVATSKLNDEVKVVEDKKIEKLDQTLNRLDISDDYYRYIMENRFKINEIIDYLEEK